MPSEEDESAGRKYSAEETLEMMDGSNRRYQQEHEQRKAAALAGGKEPFDLDVFYETYKAARTFPEPPRAEAAVSWERRYFESLRCDTVKSFADFMNLNDVYDGR